jgi:hypothetical protein
MARVNVPLIGDLAIIQGETYQALSLEFPGDKTDWTPRGQIRTKLLGDAGTLLAAFSFATPAYDDESDATTIYPRLTPTQTAAILKTKWQGTGEYSKTAVYYYDVELESDDGEVVKSVPAIVQVVGEVTGPGVPPASLETFLVSQNNLSDIDDPAIARQNLGLDDALVEDLIISLSDEVNLLYPDTNIYRFQLRTTLTNIILFATANEAPTGSSIVVDINLNGVSVFDSAQLSIPSGARDSSATTYDLLTTTFPIGSWLSFDIDQVGATFRGTGLKVYITGERS